MSDRETLSVYAKRAADYAAMSNDFNARDPSLEAFITSMPKGGRVLDLGCGPGASAAQMANAGLVVDAFDPVPEMVEMAAQNEGVTAMQAGFDDVESNAVYDGIWANFSLLHAPRADMPRHLAQVKTALKPGGRFHVAVKTGVGDERDSLGRFYTYYTEAELTGLLEKAGFTVTERRAGRDKGLSGDVSPWVALAAYA